VTAGISQLTVLTLLGLTAAPASGTAPEVTVRDGVYSTAQAAGGKALYSAQCSLCHRDSLTGGINESPPLKGPRFLSDWDGMALRALYGRILSTMPKADPGSLSEEETLSLVAYLLQENGYPPGERPLASPAVLDGIRITLPR
jgi:cytochrome c5